MKLSEPLLIEKQSMPALSENLTKIYLMLGWYRWVDFSVHSHHISHGPPERWCSRTWVLSQTCKCCSVSRQLVPVDWSQYCSTVCIQRCQCKGVGCHCDLLTIWLPLVATITACTNLCKLAQAKKVSQSQAQPARSKFWQVHAVNFFYGPPFPIQDICIIQNASICLVSTAQGSKASFVYFSLPSLSMMMATKIQPLRSVKSL